jgi:hypothetical protein
MVAHVGQVLLNVLATRSLPATTPRARSEVRQSGSSAARGSIAGDFTFGLG